MLQSAWSVLLAAVILPPLGFVLLWLRPGTRFSRKLLGSVVIAGWTVAYLSLFFGLSFPRSGSGMPQPAFYDKEAHYAELERSRALAVPPEPTAPVKTTEARPVGVAYWTDFRGPHRDGRYDQTQIGSEWPAKGLPLVWRQPIGGGY